MKKWKSIRCPYCGGTAVLRDAFFVYGRNSHGGQIYVCSHYPKCNAYVGVHTGTLIPNGSLADKELRKKRIQAHIGQFGNYMCDQLILESQNILANYHS